MILDGISIAHYRGFGSEEQLLSPLSKMNFLVGKNNSGKSNVLRFISGYFNRTGIGFPSGESTDVTKPKGVASQGVRVGVRLKPDNQYLRRLLQKSLDHKQLGFRDVEAFMEQMFVRPLRDIWVYYGASYGGARLDLTDYALKETQKHLPEVIQNFYMVFRALSPMDTHDRTTHLAGIAQALNPLVQTDAYTADLIPAVRSIFKPATADHKTVDGSFVDGTNNRYHGGAGLLQRLKQLESPRATRVADRAKFERILSVLRDLLGEPTMNFHISHDSAELIVNLDGKQLLLQDLGTGIDQLFLVACLCTLFENQIVCIEEPENHLHASLQRKLMHFLHTETSNQYFISTHSSHILDAVPCSIFELKLDEKKHARIKLVESDSERHSAVRELGYKPSDIVQANAVIWVEGPSDRAYILHWLKLTSPQFVEGVHFSIMFYGGRLLSHVSADDEAVDDFIRLSRLNQKIAIVMDSDKSTSADALNETKARVIKELRATSNHVWVTDGRTIENYLPKSVLEDSLTKMKRKPVSFARLNQFTNVPMLQSALVGGIKASRTDRAIDKVKLARLATDRTDKIVDADLAKRLAALESFIRSAN